MNTIYYIFLGIIVLSFITGLILNRLEKKNNKVEENSVNKNERKDNLNIDILDSITNDDSKTRIFAMPISSNYIEKEKVEYLDKPRIIKIEKVIEDEIL